LRGQLSIIRIGEPAGRAVCPLSFFPSGSLVMLLLIFLTLGATHAPRMVLVEGDRELAEFLVSVQHQNLASYERGSARFHLRFIEGEGDHKRGQEFEGQVLWSGERTYWKYRNRQGNVPHGGSEPEFGPWRDLETLDGPGLLANLQHGGQRDQLFVTRDRQFGLHPVLRITPREAWFRHDADGRLWADQFDGSDPFNNTHTFAVRRDGPERATIERIGTDGSVHLLEFSLAHGWNVIRYEYEPEANGFPSRGSYEWEKHESGVWYLRNYEFERQNYVGKDFGAKTYRLEISDFDPAPQIASNRFELSSLNLKPGTLVDERNSSGRRRYTYGTASADSRPVEQRLELDRLAEQLRSSGFAAEGRDKD
jgi:hypothetical protein